jgi:hypothetical protein
MVEQQRSSLSANGVLCLQIETVQRVTNARQLAKPGVDCLTCRPTDLSFDPEAHPAFPFEGTAK